MTEAENHHKISRGRFVANPADRRVKEPLSRKHQSVTRIIPLTVINLVTLKAGAKNELLFNKPASESQYNAIKIVRIVPVTVF